MSTTGSSISDTVIPTAGAHKKGDFVHNINPSELGTPTKKYIIFGWVCVTAGTPGTWLECRTMTGN